MAAPRRKRGPVGYSDSGTATPRETEAQAAARRGARRAATRAPRRDRSKLGGFAEEHLPQTGQEGTGAARRLRLG